MTKRSSEKLQPERIALLLIVIAAAALFGCGRSKPDSALPEWVFLKTCPHCSRSIHVDLFHYTTVWEGKEGGGALFEFDAENKVRLGGEILLINALCKDCWSTLTPEERLPYYHNIFQPWTMLDEEQRCLIDDAVLAGK